MTLNPPPRSDSCRDGSGWSSATPERATRSAASDPLAPCTPALLASLGPLLCLRRVGDAHPLAGHSAARSVRAWVGLTAEGPREALLFFDALRRPCWRLYLLPDSDCLAWERAVACLEPIAAPACPGLASEGWQAPVRRLLRNPLWHACALRLHAVSTADTRARLAVSDAALSEAGWRTARRIARAEGAETIAWPESMGQGGRET